MKKVVVLAALLWAASLAVADQDQATQDQATDADERARPEPPRLSADPEPGQPAARPGDETAERGPAVRESLMRKVVITVDGDEIGVVNDVGYSATHGEAVAVVDIDEFIGIGEKRIAIPLSQLQATDAYSDTVMTTFTRDAIEAEEAFDEANFTAIE